MAKKRMRLPDDFEALVEAGDVAGLESVFDICDLAAVDGKFKRPALGFTGLPEEFVRWLVAQGADIEQVDTFGRTPLDNQVRSRKGDVELYLALGADIEAPDRMGSTPLFHACARFQPDAVRVLIAHGANIEATEAIFGRTPLAEVLATCANAQIVQAADIAEMLLAAGAKVTTEMLNDVARIGKQFEFHRASFSKDLLSATDAALNRLYGLFGVTPVAPLRRHDGVAPITVTATSWGKQHDELWDLLVPSSGAAATVQGEVIRITGRVAHEILDNGGGNWDDGFRQMLDALLTHLGSGVPLSPSDLAHAKEMISRIRPHGDGDPERLSEMAVSWVLGNPTTTPLDTPTYNR